MTACTATPCAPSGARVVLVSPYELGRQPFNLAQPAAWFGRAGMAVMCVDLSQQQLDPATFAHAEFVAIYLGMHTATRIAAAALPKLRTLAPRARIAAFGLYAPVNAAWLKTLGVEAIFGGESEPDLLAWVQSGVAPADAVVRRDKIEFLLPDRRGLPALQRYANLILADGTQKITGFAEASRGCKHLCRHCPVVPVYEGMFRVVPVEMVIADIAQQVAVGAAHISFGDPDFLNGPTHALKVAEALHARFPDLSWDATIKVEHLLSHAELLPRLQQCGLLFIVTAVESVDDAILDKLAKGHAHADFETVLAHCRALGIALAPTFVPFTPWTTLAGYRDLLATLLRLHLVEAVPPVQLAIRLLVPQGSYLMQLPDFAARVGAFDEAMLGYPWQADDPRVDALQRDIMAWVMDAEKAALPRAEVFAGLWARTHAALGEAAPPLDPTQFGDAIPHHSEPWYCCAEPTETQLASF
ncbi:MAG: radical SAM protein [Gammaproteobacteria bacterium]|nr:radical SAM protein [Gammaproteobacteria bacterium]MBU1409378.1 radical SAM protein [Gammaproteobacteria bacterium]MBU1531292.1 radical SAM protein [Gammaproteobacteria bacterium]